MRTILRAWVKSRRSSLTQVHLHIDDPSLVIYQKAEGQKIRDGSKVRAMNGGDLNVEQTVVNRLEFDEELSVPWTSLLIYREFKDEWAALHLFLRPLQLMRL